MPSCSNFLKNETLWKFGTEAFNHRQVKKDAMEKLFIRAVTDFEMLMLYSQISKVSQIAGLDPKLIK